MYNECRHIKPSGARCHSPALHGQPRCYFHTNVRRTTAPTKFDDLSIKFPVLEDRRAIQIALTQVLEAVAASRLDPRRAGLLLYGLQIAVQITPKSSFTFVEPVRTLHPEGEDDVLAPEKAVCEPPEDCRDCPKKDRCEDYDEDDDDDECDPQDSSPHPLTLSLLGCAEQPCNRAQHESPHKITPLKISRPELLPAPRRCGCPRSGFSDLGSPQASRAVVPCPHHGLQHEGYGPRPEEYGLQPVHQPGQINEGLQPLRETLAHVISNPRQNSWVCLSRHAAALPRAQHTTIGA